jgi:hypothetical protein
MEQNEVESELQVFMRRKDLSYINVDTSLQYSQYNNKCKFHDLYSH